MASATAISGQVVNNGNARLENVQLLVTYAWHWTNERHPGTDAPGWAEFHTLPNALLPGAKATFSFEQGHADPGRNDGNLVATVQLVGFTEYPACCAPR